MIVGPRRSGPMGGDDDDDAPAAAVVPPPVAEAPPDDPNGKRAPGTEEERAVRLAKMMESQVNMEAPERVGLKTGYRCAPAAPQRWPRRATALASPRQPPAPLLPEHVLGMRCG